MSAPTSTRLRAIPRKPLALLLAILAGAALALGIIAFNARETYATLERSAATRQTAYEFVMALRQFRQHVGEVRVGLTGYVVTRDSLYRATYLGGMNGFRTDTTRMRSLTQGAASLERELDKLSEPLQAYASAMAEAMLVADRASSRATGTPRLSREALLLERLRLNIVALEQEQTRLMDAAAQDVASAVRESRNVTTWVFIIALVLVIGAGGFGFAWLLSGEMDRRQREASAREEAFFLASPVPMLLYDPASGRIAQANHAATTQYGYDDVAIRGVRVGDLQRERSPLPTDALTRGIVRHKRRDGSTFDADVTVTTVGMPGQQHALAIIRDITEQRALEKRLRRATQIEAVGRLAMGLSHDFDLILDLVRGSAESLLKALPANHPNRFEATAIHQAITRGSELTRQLVAIGQLHPGTASQEVEAIAVAPKPAPDPAPPLVPAAGPRVRRPSGEINRRRTVHVVDDDPSVLRVVVRALRDQGHHVLTAADGTEALKVVEAHEGAIDLLVTDVVLPGLSGVAVAHALSIMYPSLPVLFISGTAPESTADERGAAERTGFLKKPFSAEELIGAVDKLLQ